MFRRIITAALLAVSLTGVASADPVGDLNCHLKNRKGVDVYYAFDGNSENANGSFGGTMVETS